MIILTISLAVLVVILGFTTINLLRKNERAEDIVVNYVKYLDAISKAIEISDKKIQQLDANKRFSGDDEIGFFFTTVKKIQEILNQFKVKKY